ncbi:MAG: divalent metal cation transporter, partial [Sphingobium sp.]
TRLLAIVPAVAVAIIYGPSGAMKLLIFSQIVLSLQLPFAVVPLVRMTSDRGMMGNFVNKGWLKIAAWTVSAIIIALNLKLLSDFILP